MSEIKSFNFTKSQKMALDVWREKIQLAESVYRQTGALFEEFLKTLQQEIGVNPELRWRFLPNFMGMEVEEVQEPDRPKPVPIKK